MGIVEKADVINFTVILFVLLIVTIAGFEMVLVWTRATDPLTALDGLRSWVMAFATGIFAAYGLTRNKEG